ncbi:MAG: hypothetical protein K0R67_308 [Paenibacillus sp.]|nr:hypothetical protein [Paenibacillus sp.]
MPNYFFQEIWTPLKLIGIKFFRDDEGSIWIKWFSRPRRKL